MSIAAYSKRAPFLLAAVLVMLPLGSPSVSPVMAQPAAMVQVFQEMPSSVDSIFRLSHPDFRMRQQAAQRLLEDGMDAWDWLYRAARCREPEVALTAHRLMRQIPIEEELVKLVPGLAGYCQENQATRMRTLIRLGQSPSVEAQSALALLTRVESDEQLSRWAAIELITGPHRPISNLAQLVNHSPRVASAWLVIHAQTANNFQDFTQLWQPTMVGLVKESFAAAGGEASHELVLWYVAQLLLRNEESLAADMVAEIVDRVPEHPAAVIEMFDWLLLYRQWAGCEQLVKRFPELTHSDPRLIFRRAELARQRGDQNQADQIAETANQMIQLEETPMRLQSAIHLQLAGLPHWSAQSLALLIADPVAEVTVRVQASSLLAELQGQQLDFAAAADTLAKALRGSSGPGSSVQPLLKSIQIRHHYFCHLWSVESGDWESAEQHLLDGLQRAPNNSDLLIAMLRYTSSGDRPAGTWRETARELIELALQRRLSQIETLRVGYDKDPRQARLRQERLVSELNAYAWLASQSGMALPQAESLAREATQLSPADGHVLDTLAACLFARAKLSEALVWQQQALKYAPWSAQIRGGLDRYRQAMLLAEMQGLFR